VTSATGAFVGRETPVAEYLRHKLRLVNENDELIGIDHVAKLVRRADPVESGVKK
jgi:hypothetical protein